MKYHLSIFTAAAAAIAAMIRSLSGDSFQWVDPADFATPIPPITERLVEKYASIGGTDQEIADRFDIDVAELRRHYGRVLRVAHAVHRLTVRRWQFECARKLTCSILIWLGRNILGQSLSPAEPGQEMPDYPADA